MSLVDQLKQAADEAGAVEASFRREAAERIRLLEQERSFAFRRYNVIRSVATAIASAENEEAACLRATAQLRAQLDLPSSIEAAVAEYFSPVARLIYASLKPEPADCIAEARAALGDFEAWYAATYGRSFWMLLEVHMVETPVVDF